jgi:hypothetical protein
MLHSLALAGTIAALHMTGGSTSVTMTVPLICQDYSVAGKVVTHCNDEQASVTVNGVPLGRPYLPGRARTSDAANPAAAVAPVAVVPTSGNATLCVRCSFH